MKKTFLILITNQFSTQGRISAFILDEKSKEPKDLEFKTNADAVKWLKENESKLPKGYLFEIKELYKNGEFVKTEEPKKATKKAKTKVIKMPKSK